MTPLPGKSERRIDPRDGLVWAVDEIKGSVVMLVREDPLTYRTVSYGNWICWDRAEANS